MTTNIATTKEQSARLLQCGVSTESADMSWVRGAANVSDGNLSLHPYRRMQRINWQSMRGRSEIVPAWSLSALLGLLPKKIMNGVSRIYTVEIAYSHTFNDAPWTINYEGNGLNKNAHFNGKSPIEACVKAIEWLTANNYKLNQL